MASSSKASASNAPNAGKTEVLTFTALQAKELGTMFFDVFRNQIAEVFRNTEQGCSPKELNPDAFTTKVGELKNNLVNTCLPELKMEVELPKLRYINGDMIGPWNWPPPDKRYITFNEFSMTRKEYSKLYNGLVNHEAAIYLAIMTTKAKVDAGVEKAVPWSQLSQYQKQQIIFNFYNEQQDCKSISANSVRDGYRRLFSKAQTQMAEQFGAELVVDAGLWDPVDLDENGGSMVRFRNQKDEEEKNEKKDGGEEEEAPEIEYDEEEGSAEKGDDGGEPMDLDD